MRLIALLLFSLSACAGARVEPATDVPPNGFAEVAGGRIHYGLSGRGPPLVLLHGGRLDLSMWDAVVPHLADRFRVLRWDAPGHGATTVPAQATANTADELLQLLDRLGLRRVTLVGFSMGAGTATGFAIDHPSRVDRLILISTSGPPPGAPVAASGHPPLSDPEGRRRLAATALPVLMIVGGRDGERIRTTAEAVSREVPSAELLVFANAPHNVIADRPLEVAAAVRRFASAGSAGRR